jgi:hypothetical protein
MVEDIRSRAMAYENLDQVLFMQARVARQFREAEKLTASAFLELDKKRDLLGFVAESYEAFHLTGDQGILDAVAQYAADG